MAQVISQSVVPPVPAPLSPPLQAVVITGAALIVSGILALALHHLIPARPGAADADDDAYDWDWDAD